MDGVSVADIMVRVFSLSNLAFALIGVALGIIFGALPGFTAAMGIAVLLSLTYGMDPARALIFLGAIFQGAMYGGSVSAILINTPGTPSAAATTLDGYPMAKKGLASEALRESVFASFMGGMVGITALLILSPQLAKIALMFGPPEYFMLAIFGLTIIASVSEVSILKGLLSGFLGVLIGTIGMDPLLGRPRFTLGFPELIDGIQLIPAMIGLFSIPEVLSIIHAYWQGRTEVVVADVRKLKIGFPSLRHVISFLPIYIRSALIGVLIGIIPGAGGSIASFLAYNETRRTSKTPERFGTGVPEGVAAAESANNAMAGGALIPMLTLGVPGDAVSAIMMGALMLYGLRPGGELYKYNAHVVFTFIVGLYVACIFTLLLGLYCVPYFAKVLNAPKHVLAVSIVLFTVLGSYALSNNMFDVYVMVAFGVVGYLLKQFGFSVVPMVLGMILGPMAEKGLNNTLAISYGQNVVFFILKRPICLVLFSLAVFSVAISLYRWLKGRSSVKEVKEHVAE